MPGGPRNGLRETRPEVRPDHGRTQPALRQCGGGVTRPVVTPGTGIPHGSATVTTHVGVPGPGPPSGRVERCRDVDSDAVGVELGLRLGTDTSDWVTGTGPEQPDSAQLTAKNVTARRRHACVRSTAG